MTTALLKNAKNYPLTAEVMVIDDQLTSRVIMESIIKSIGDNIRVTTYDNAISALNDDWGFKSSPMINLCTIEYVNFNDAIVIRKLI